MGEDWRYMKGMGVCEDKGTRTGVGWGGPKGSRVGGGREVERSTRAGVRVGEGPKVLVFC